MSNPNSEIVNFVLVKESIIKILPNPQVLCTLNIEGLDKLYLVSYAPFINLAIVTSEILEEVIMISISPRIIAMHMWSDFICLRKLNVADVDQLTNSRTPRKDLRTRPLPSLVSLMLDEETVDKIRFYKLHKLLEN